MRPLNSISLFTVANWIRRLGMPLTAARMAAFVLRRRLYRIPEKREIEMPTVHELKSWPEFFEPVYTGRKNFELRKNDRHFQVGDVIRLREWRPVSELTRVPYIEGDATYGHDHDGDYTGRECRRRITYILEGIGVGAMQGVIKPYWGLDRGYAILGLEI
jgi:hypothetical protein